MKCINCQNKRNPLKIKQCNEERRRRERNNHLFSICKDTQFFLNGKKMNYLGLLLIIFSIFSFQLSFFLYLCFLVQAGLVHIIN